MRFDHKFGVLEQLPFGACTFLVQEGTGARGFGSERLVYNVTSMTHPSSEERANGDERCSGRGRVGDCWLPRSPLKMLPNRGIPSYQVRKSLAREVSPLQQVNDCGPHS